MAQPLPEHLPDAQTAQSAQATEIAEAPAGGPRAVGTQADEVEPLALGREIVQLASDKGAADILLMDLRKMSIIADCFVICSGDNERQIRAISRGIQDGVAEKYGLDIINRTGADAEQGGWVLLDYGSVIVHIFSPQMRDFYRLERLWSDAATLLRMQ
jgi:ribosome-associated protein